MHKISKKDGPQQSNEEFWTWYNNRPISSHFLPGTWIMSSGRRGFIQSAWRDGSLTIFWDDDSVSNIKPIALNR